jgi:hypothetical protein
MLTGRSQRTKLGSDRAIWPTQPRRSWSLDQRPERPRSSPEAQPAPLLLAPRAGNDVVLVAELAGHLRLETTRRYSLPSHADRQQAMDALEVED